MYKKLSFIVVFFMTTMLTACGWHFKNTEVLPKEFQTLTLQTSDQYSDMARALRSELLLNNVKLVPAQPNVAVLRLNSTTNGSRVASVFKQAREAEKILSVKVSTTVTIPNKGHYPIDVIVHRSFFDDSRAALAKSSEREMMIADMYQQAARRVIVKMVTLNPVFVEK
ncbi:LPS assembly lipoprotein LptE [Pasteurella skyensis]|uniref:LPS-assembly lipoprotein LptE n=1 Tax=Phocoenobacter skyensis TaxID=97481 RepID=A0AAJ6P1Z2_9PAST|nr:LPS assembly lipoprotein LptE [Pasteurella skyensis]MDP8161923.1 LPS assembly lipoprotein LptE [Pasteurella skyensis]MDP8170662.1 LPS assembly lipoprotein LptE [Pasteurella skyensis]MDP8172079.1 LPS assembly lipoprotein LptE [Pasteurella skyensis]MDP8174257.1 LPS assembly lipoprotein LptE [Pasteurella skyensis]MDP8176573.1 LPS assembly lipoprotein LptE [Pasteurella skyensis]